MKRNILVSGASIAGNALAYWLAERGCTVTVIEKTPDFRDGGQNVDVRGIGREVLRRMGIEQAALDRGTGEEGTVWVDERGHPTAGFVTADMDGDGPTAEMEILRGDLARLLYETVGDRAHYRFGTTIAGIEENDAGVDIAFDDGTSGRFDLVVVAEGVGSPTRERVFPGENDPRWMDLTTAYFTIPRTADDDRMWRFYNAPGRRNVHLRPDAKGTARAVLMVSKPSEGEENWDRKRQQAFLRDRFADAGWQTPRVLAGMEASDDFYFDVLRQVRMKRWSNGRVILTGDAAWCVTPLGGIGATLAITGAYVLAQELTRIADITTAVAAYDGQMRPMVEERQSVPRIVPRLAHPDTRLGIGMVHRLIRLASLSPVRSLFEHLPKREKPEPDLSRYA